MKKIILLASILIVSFSLKAQPYNSYGNEFGYFYSSLSPYGNWIEINDGVMAWQPFNVRRDWVPYQNGRWIWTNDGWYWDSYEPFGYIVFHYGRWYYDNYYGWLWIPDYDWAPAWVEWRYDNDYIGWAPLPPYASFSVRLGLHFTFNFFTPYHHWHFVRYNHFCNAHVYNYFMGPKYRYRIFSHTKYRTDYGYSNGRIINRGVNIDYIRQRSGQRITERQIHRVNDARELRNNKLGNDRIRAYIPSREQMSRYRVNDVRVKRATRGTSLDVSKLRIGNRGNVIRSNGRIMEPKNRELEKINRERKINQRNNDLNNSRNLRTVPNIRRDNNRDNRVEKRNNYYTSPKRENHIQNERPSRVQREVRREPSRSSSPQVRRNEVRRTPSRSSAPRINRESRSSRNNERNRSNENKRHRR